MNPKYERLIDGTDYRTIESYLLDPREPIEFILHVRSLEDLSDLAAQLDQHLQQPYRAQEAVRSILRPLLEQGRLLLTPGRPVMVPTEQMVPPGQIAADIFCQTIYLPPFYLSHTEGVFEARAVKNSPQPALGPAAQSNPGQRMKI